MAPNSVDSRDSSMATAISPPLLSVIIPTFRREDQVVRAVNSVLAEGLASFEIRVIDDSPDASAQDAVEAIGDPRVHYSVMEKPTGGIPALVRNRGIEESAGDILYFLDDDDVIAQHGLSSMLDALEHNKSAGVAFGTVDCFGPDDDIVKSYNQWFGWAGTTAKRFRRSSLLTVGIAMFRGTMIINSACCLRRSVALELGGYDPSIPVYEDVEFFLRAIRSHGHVFVDRPVLQYSTGLQSMINDLDGDGTPIAESYKIMHHKYIEANGQLEYRALQVLSKLLPLGLPEGHGV